MRSDLLFVFGILFIIISVSVLFPNYIEQKKEEFKVVEHFTKDPIGQLLFGVIVVTTVVVVAGILGKLSIDSVKTYTFFM